jgi:hypothetical protein
MIDKLMNASKVWIGEGGGYFTIEPMYMLIYNQTSDEIYNTVARTIGRNPIDFISMIYTMQRFFDA